MSHLAHLDVEQGRLAEADAVLVDALRLSEERDIPICSGSGACGPGCGC
jgi:hypothetical protein